MPPERQPSALSRVIPSLAWLSSYRGEWWRADLVAGLTAGAVVIPKAMAYAPLTVSTTTTIAMLEGAPLGQRLGRERLIFNLEMAVAKYQSLRGGEGT